MEVQLVTTIITIIEVDPENTDDIEVARREIFGRFNDNSEEIEERVEGIFSLHNEAVVHDTIIGTSVTHSFGAV